MNQSSTLFALVCWVIGNLILPLEMDFTTVNNKVVPFAALS